MNKIGTILRHYLKRLYRINLFVSVLICIVMLVFVGEIALSAYSETLAYEKIVKVKSELEAYRHFFAAKVKRMRITLMANKPVSDDESPLTTFHFSFDDKDYQKLSSDLPKSGRSKYYPAFFKTNEDAKVRKVKFRFRGDSNYHWFYPQKSLRVQTQKDEIYNMERVFNLINPPELDNITDSVNNAIARKLGIMAPDFYPVRVFVNSRYMGVYIFASQANESLLRKHKKMPGSLYYGDGAAQFASGFSKLWLDQKYWVKKGARNAEQKNNREDISFFIRSINRKDQVSFYKFFNQFMDKKVYYSYFALDSFTGTIHHTYNQNHKLYFDPYKGKFEPIEWDVRYWVTAKNKDNSYYPLLNRVRLNPVLEYERDQVSWDLIQSDQMSAKSLSESLDHYDQLQRRDLKSDIYRDDATSTENVRPAAISVPFYMKDYDAKIVKDKENIGNREIYIKGVYEKAWGVFKVEKKGSASQIIFRATGNSPIKVDLSGAFVGKIYQDENFNGTLDAMDKIVANPQAVTLYPGRKKTNQSKDYKHAFKIKEAPLYYSYIVTGAVSAPAEIAGTNAITGAKLTLTQAEFKVDLQKADSIHPWKLPVLTAQTKTLSGTIKVNETLVFDAQTQVNILPGTTFLLAPKKSIYFYGKVTAVGTAAKPIKFLPQNPSKPFGLVAIQGKAASGSVMRHFELKGGSVDVRNLIHYTAALNLHDLDSFEVSDCVIGENFIGDDAMHIAYAKGKVERCLFENARSDGLDVDISDVEISDSIFYKSGNDGLDLMTTTAKLTRNLYYKTGDKGVSVGEWSKAEITDSIFIDTLIGIEVKDKSNVVASDLYIKDSGEKAINLYNKNLRYDEGGHLQGQDITIVGNKLVKADKKSSIKIGPDSLFNLEKFRPLQPLLDRVGSNLEFSQGAGNE
ncbi:MAG: CotH kinase family protein [SAR324 cluster bacterium]|nr:CotH kinase family protein [SAR324 cluster bacterium]